MNIKQLEAFTLVAELGSFTKAAKLMFMTQPAISFQIKALEDQLGIQLLERTEKSIYLTEAGRPVYTEAKKILACHRAILEHIAEVRGLTKGTLSLGASTIPGEYLLPQFLGEFRQNHPEIELILEIGSTQRITELVLSRQVHLAVVGALSDHSNLEYLPLFTDQVVVIVAKNHHLAGKKTVSLEELARQELIFREQGSGTRAVIEERLRNTGINPDGLNVVMELGSTRAIITAVQGNLGVGMVSGLAVRDALELGTVCKLDISGLNFQRSLYLLSNKTSPGSLLQKAFAEFLLAKTEERCDD